MKLTHKHITVNATIDPSFEALPREDAKRFIDRLMATVDMKPLGELNWADAEDLDFPGQSFVQMITTSHCSLHFFDHTSGEKEIYFDLYSCKDFDENKVIGLLDEKFGLLEWNGTLHCRHSGKHPEVRILKGKRKQLIAAKN